MSLGLKIKELRKEQGLSQVELGKRSGIHEKLLSKYENGRIVPTADTLKKLAETLHISADYLIFDNAPKEGNAELADLDLFNKFKQVEEMDEDEKDTVKKVIDAMIIKSKVEKAVKSKPQEPWGDRMKNLGKKTSSRAKGYSEKEIEKIVGEAVKAVRREEKRKAS